VLYFLVRDWCYPYQYAYGTAGGDVLLDKRLQVGPAASSLLYPFTLGTSQLCHLYFIVPTRVF